MLADLHVHTTASDGVHSPSTVVSMAAETGLAALAIADHDTLGGVGEAVEAGYRYGLEVLPAIELGAELGGREIHVLGYLVDLQDLEFSSQLDFFRRSRRQRVVKIVEKLRMLGFPITYERVLEIAGGGSVGRPHIARALVEAGAVKSRDEAFNLYLGNGKPAYEPRFKLSPPEAVRMIRRAGGVAVFAHPGLAGCDSFIPSLVQEGLQGLEVYHPGHDSAVSRHYLGICRQYGLLATGGSDYHGGEHRGHTFPGMVTVGYQVVNEIKKLAREVFPG